MPYGTRHKNAVMGGARADDRAPYYHTSCVQKAMDEARLPFEVVNAGGPFEGRYPRDIEGRPLVWVGRLACGFDNETCELCGEVLYNGD